MRYSSIDVLRTCAIFVMVFVHFGENLSGYTFRFAGFGAPLFAFLSGVSYCLWVKGQRAKGISDAEISKISVRRSLFVFGVGFAFNILVWMPEDTFNWDVLTFVGTALFVLNIARQAPLPISALAAVLAVLISPILRAQAGYESYWVNNYYDPDMTLSDVLLGFFSVGYFPVFPWIAFSLTGFVTSSLLFVRLETESEKGRGSEKSPSPIEADSPPNVLPFTTFGLLLIGTSLTLLAMRGQMPELFSQKLIGGWTMFPPTIPYVCGTLGMTLVLLSLTHLWIDRNPVVQQWESLLTICKTFSRYSFTMYILHHVVHLYPMWIYALVQGKEPTYYWMNALPLQTSLVLAFVFMACAYGVLRLLGSQRNYGLESLMRWLCD